MTTTTARWSVQTEEIQVGDVVPGWFEDDKGSISARVTKVRSIARSTVMVAVEPERFAPSHRSYKYGRTVTVLRGA